MHERYFALCGGLYGSWGQGGSPLEAVENAPMSARERKAKKTRFRVVRAFGRLPFAPTDRDAAPGEADAWVDKAGAVNYSGCELEEIEPAASYDEIVRGYPEG